MFTKEDEKMIGLIMHLCMQDELLKKNLEKRYDNEPELLNPYEIYIVEEVFRYGLNNYYQELKICGNTLSEIVSKYKTFMSNCKNIPNYKILKVKDYYRNVNLLENIERICIKLILKNNKEKETINKIMMYKYDDYVELEIDSEADIKTLISNIVFRDFLDTYLKVALDKDTYNNMLERQLMPGMFAHVDKEYIISKMNDENTKNMINHMIDDTYNAVREDLKDEIGLNKIKYVFSKEIVDMKTNISYEDVYGKSEKKKNSEL